MAGALPFHQNSTADPEAARAPKSRQATRAGAWQAKADGEVRWAVLNTITLLRRYEPVHKKLAAAMLEGASVGEAVAVIESNLGGIEL